MLTPDQQSRRAVLIASLENALEFHQQVLELRELLELEHKDAYGLCWFCEELHAAEVAIANKTKPATDFEDEPTKERTPTPCLDETKMHGYCDQFGGSDDPNDGFTGELIPNPRTCGVASGTPERGVPITDAEPIAEPWRLELRAAWRMHFNKALPPLSYLVGLTSIGPLGRSRRQGKAQYCWVDSSTMGRSAGQTIRALWPLEQQRRNVLAKSPTIVLPEEVAVLMPGDYVVPSGTYNRDELEENNWIYQGNLDGSSVEESAERILAAIDRRGAQILADGVES